MWLSHFLSQDWTGYSCFIVVLKQKHWHKCGPHSALWQKQTLDTLSVFTVSLLSCLSYLPTQITQKRKSSLESDMYRLFTINCLWGDSQHLHIYCGIIGTFLQPKKYIRLVTHFWQRVTLLPLCFICTQAPSLLKHLDCIILWHMNFHTWLYILRKTWQKKKQKQNCVMQSYT